MKLLLLTFALAAVMVAYSLVKPTEGRLPPELLEKSNAPVVANEENDQPKEEDDESLETLIESKKVEVFQKYLAWIAALPPGSDTRFGTFLEYLKDEEDTVEPIVASQKNEEVQAAEKRKEAVYPVAANEEDDQPNENDDDETLETLIESKKVEVFRKYLAWKAALSPGSDTRFRTFLEYLKNEADIDAPAVADEEDDQTNEDEDESPETLIERNYRSMALYAKH